MKSLSLTTLLVLSRGARMSNGFRSFSHHTVLSRVASSRTQPLVPHSAIASQTEASWYPSTVLRNVRVADGLRHIDIEVDDITASRYLHAGQYVKMKKTGGKPAMFAMASPPDSRRTFSFLVKESHNHQFVLDLPPGAHVDLSTPLGKGFQTQNVLDTCSTATSPVTHILLMACGSGLAPIAAAIESGCLQQQRGASKEVGDGFVPRSVLLYIGARSPAHLPYAEKYAEWEERGVKVSAAHHTVSMPPLIFIHCTFASSITGCSRFQ